jgi:hypothetical protein
VLAQDQDEWPLVLLDHSVDQIRRSLKMYQFRGLVDELSHAAIELNGSAAEALAT